MRRLHFFKHPWSLRVTFRSAFDDIRRELGVGETLNIQVEGRTVLSIKFEGKDLTVTQLAPWLSASPSKQRRWLDFAEEQS